MSTRVRGVILDSKAYPHLLDCVVDLASRGALLRLRGVSRYLRKRCDARLIGDHILISMTADRNYHYTDDMPVVVSSPSGRLPVFWAWSRAGSRSPLHDRSRINDLGLWVVCTLDLVGPVPPSALRTQALVTEAAPRYLRIIPDLSQGDISIACLGPQVPWVIPDSVNTVVRFCTLPHLHLYLGQKIASNSPQVSVINIAFHPDDLSVGGLAGFDRLALPHQMVYIFHPARRATRLEKVGKNGARDSRSMLDNVVWDLWEDRDGVSITIVGIEVLAGHGWLESAEGDTQAQFVTKWVEESEHLGIHGLGEDEFRAWIAAHVTFMTLDRYRSMVGPERAGAETVAVGWPW